MRKCPSTIMLIFCALSFAGNLPCSAQSLDRDSLRQTIARGKKDSNTVKAYSALALSYYGIHPDSAYFYAYPGAILGREIGFKRGEASNLAVMGIGLSQMGDYARALDTMLQSLKIYEQINENGKITTALWAISQNYEQQQDYIESVRYLMQGLKLEEKLHDTSSIGRAQTFIGRAYEQMGRLDSALYYLKRANGIAVAANSMGDIFLSELYLAMLYTKMHMDDQALVYFHRHLPLLILSNLNEFLCESYLYMGQIFERKRRKDSVLYYGRQSLVAAQSSNLVSRQLDATQFLAAFYKTNHEPDSALRYLELTIALKDSLFNQQKLKTVQTLTFTERIRQQEIEEQRRQAEAKATKNLQLLAIGLFIPVFFLFVLFLSRVKVKARTVEFLGLIGLLMLFEFITDLVFPWISDWTNDSPIWEMLTLVIIAIMLEPLNHRLEKWVKSLLVHRKSHYSINTAPL
jgi:tetratricopeptide (TPR) repeat protein